MTEKEISKQMADAVDCTTASAGTVKSYFDRGFPVILQKEKIMPFIKYYMKSSLPGSEMHTCHSIPDGLMILKKLHDR
jgi:hypothetical protein